MPSEGDDPAFAVALSSGKEVVILNYSSGNGRIFPTTTSAELFNNASTAAPIITFPPPPGNVSHPHMALQYKNEIFVSDLVSFARRMYVRSACLHTFWRQGSDKVWRLSRPDGGNYSITGSIPQPAGSGPRHIQISGMSPFSSSFPAVCANPAFSASQTTGSTSSTSSRRR